MKIFKNKFSNHGKKIIYLGESMKPVRDAHKHLEYLLIKNKVYITDQGSFPIINGYCIVYIIDERGVVGGYELKETEFTFIDAKLRNERIDVILK